MFKNRPDLQHCPNLILLWTLKAKALKISKNRKKIIKDDLKLDIQNHWISKIG